MVPEGLVGDRAAARTVRWMSGRRGETVGWGQVLEDWYVGVFTAVTLLVMVFAGAGGGILQPDCTVGMCPGPDGYRLIGAGLAVSGVVGLLLLARAGGPLGADPARLTWVLSTPADRGVLLFRRLATALALAAAVGAVWGALVGLAVVGGAGQWSLAVAPIGIGVGAGALVGLVLGHLAVGLQAGATAPGRASRSVSDAELARAGAVTAAVVASVTMLEMTALEVVIARRRLGRRSIHRSRPAKGGPLTGMLRHEVRALGRRAGSVAPFVLLWPVAVVVAVLLGRLAGIVAVGAASFVVALVVAGGLRTWATSPGLRRALPAPTAAVTSVLTLPALALAVTGAGVACTVLGLPWWGGVLVGCGACAGVLRSCDQMPPGIGAVVSSPAGAVPVGLIARLAHGPDLVVGSAVLLLALAPLHGVGAVVAFAVGGALLAWQVLRPRD